ncbi:MAG: hypothetical protein JO245_02765 [Pseudolabrys sp.]|nr:hypothetical protein [Pseudolabrys sp.]
MTHALEHPLAQLVTAFVLGAMAVAAAGLANAADDKNCKVIERPASAADKSGTISSSVTAGGGQVSANSTGGNSVTVHSGNGSVASSVATTGSGGSTIVTNSDGSCVIYRTKKE